MTNQRYRTNSPTQPQHHTAHNRFLTRVNPLAKIIVSLVITGIAFSLKNVWAMGVLVGVLLVLLLLCVTRQNMRQMAQGILSGAIALLVFLAIGIGLLNNPQAATLYGLRLIAILLPTPLLALTTPPTDLVRALQAARLPAFLVLSLMLTWRFLPIIQQEAQRIFEANQLRGVDLGRQPRRNLLLNPNAHRVSSDVCVMDKCSCKAQVPPDAIIIYRWETRKLADRIVIPATDCQAFVCRDRTVPEIAVFSHSLHRTGH
ncbi:MAG: energy-coupling factor transporter transmembrane component T [Leptolyngbyaceae cyanobacterium bins.349]|nr:energy-coupling factor transporter transmembrane component T [Leptolyngbyaceae cyanobacterium bins.349]